MMPEVDKLGGKQKQDLKAKLGHLVYSNICVGLV